MPLMSASQAVVHTDPEIMGGTPVFGGTRVPAQSLFDYLEAGDSLEDFLEAFPTVSREQAIALCSSCRVSGIGKISPLPLTRLKFIHRSRPGVSLRSTPGYRPAPLRGDFTVVIRAPAASPPPASADWRTLFAGRG